MGELKTTGRQIHRGGQHVGTPPQVMRVEWIEDGQRRRMLSAWAEIRAERLAREERIMAAVRPKIEETDNG